MLGSGQSETSSSWLHTNEKSLLPVRYVTRSWTTSGFLLVGVCLSTAGIGGSSVLLLCSLLGGPSSFISGSIQGINQRWF